jgi:hypothetical protein
MTKTIPFFMIGIAFKKEKGSMKHMQIVLVCLPGRTRENLLAMIESVNILTPIIVMDTCKEVLDKIDLNVPTTILIDYRHPEARMDEEISSLIMAKFVERLVLLQSPNATRSHFTHFSTSELIYDDLSVSMLSNLFRNIEQSLEV